MTLSAAQKATLAGISSKGLHLNTGEPCECGQHADITTTKSVGYSDFATYTHRCGDCGNEFETYTEG